MPSCEHIPPDRFHGVESRRHTDACVRQLSRSKEFQRYITHREYSESLQLTWFMALIGLSIALYYHLLFVYRDMYLAPFGNFEANTIPSLFSTALLLFYIAPCVLIAPFSGFFETLPSRGALRLAVVFTFINMAVVSFGGKWLHHPPFLITEPPIPWITGKTSEARQLVTVTLTRTLPLQGGVVAGWLVYKWRRMRWKKAWHVPLPLITVPILVGVFSCLWFFLATCFVTSLTTTSFFFPVGGDTRAVGGDVVSNILSMVLAIKQEFLIVLNWLSLPVSLPDARILYHLWCATLELCVLYFLGVFLSSFSFVFRGIFWLLPTHPTTWLLSLISCLVGLNALMRSDSGNILHVLGLLTLACMLVRNGFLITP
ncbi:hypothetical protein C3747_96g13 [Trypanosoma cruzi]|uniref:Uncharacterized protein n=2 Tax=Trypanosoma cruzi TaxID=5693 RepID=Q4D715_TRYCC|nr:hypothetical protein, conserved [Trypanosoma cruzi]EAN88315.1 hypothetical protein, conserved [Trypanosoma cruzi]KAF5221412.1 hypothetical protein ECC02_005473 [Trypanosoma cruzi]PWV07877.1 hypothetical protein C3747_96g13 [Trypanosoma cruzi]RNC59671.1 hypothetical protein TcCL_ESM02731 [Trypanosoma cruzi]|eukprot:XP_810166.1 hypothetical protein [Trypanosoma cruzi strain CL Brener]